MESETAKDYKLVNLSITEETIEEVSSPETPSPDPIDFLGREIKAGDYICYTANKELRVALVLSIVLGKNRSYIPGSRFNRSTPKLTPKLKVRAAYSSCWQADGQSHISTSQLWGTITLDEFNRVMVIDSNSVPDVVKEILSKKEE